MRYMSCVSVEFEANSKSVYNISINKSNAVLYFDWCGSLPKRAVLSSRDVVQLPNYRPTRYSIQFGHLSYA